jgi:hypothetical protein
MPPLPSRGCVPRTHRSKRRPNSGGVTAGRRHPIGRPGCPVGGPHVGPDVRPAPHRPSHSPRSIWPCGPGPSAPSPRRPASRLTCDWTTPKIDAVVAALGAAVADGDRTVDDLDAAVADACGEWAVARVMPAFQTMWPRWRQAVSTAAARGALCFGPNRGHEITYASPRPWIRGFVPAPTALSALGELIEPVDLAGETRWVGAGDRPDSDRSLHGLWLLPYFEAYVVGAQPRSLVFPGKPPSEHWRGRRADQGDLCGTLDVGTADRRPILIESRSCPAPAAGRDRSRYRRRPAAVVCGQRDRYQATVCCTASRCGVGSRRPKAAWNLLASITNGARNW